MAYNQEASKSIDIIFKGFSKTGEKKKSKTKKIKNRKELDNETQTVIQEHLHFA